MATLVSFNRFVQKGDSRSERCHVCSPLSTSNSETGEQWEGRLLPVYGPSLLIIVNIPDFRHVRKYANSETGM